MVAAHCRARDVLGRAILDAFEAAVEQSEWETADHLLRALEVLEECHGEADLAVEAYRLIARTVRSSG